MARSTFLGTTDFALYEKTSSGVWKDANDDKTLTFSDAAGNPVTVLLDGVEVSSVVVPAGELPPFVEGPEGLEILYVNAGGGAVPVGPSKGGVSSWNDLTDKPVVPTTAADVGALPAATTLPELPGVATEAQLPAHLAQDMLKATFVSRGSVGERLRKAAAAALNKSMDVMATPPTITTGTAIIDATLTNAYRTSTVGTTPYRITGGTYQQGAGAYAPYAQAPVVTTPNGTGGNTPGAGGVSAQWHWSVEFDTDAPKVQLRYLNSSLTYMVEVDERPVSASGLAFPGTSGTGYSLLDFGSSKVRRIRVWYMEASGFDGVYVGPTYSVWKPKSDTGIRAAVVGDSIETGAITTIAGQTANKVAGKYLGWTDVRQVAFGGTGFVATGSFNTFGSTKRVQDAVNANPDVLMIVGSQNDAGQAGVQAAALSTFQAYRAALPNVPIVVTGVHAASSGPSASLVSAEATVKAAFNQWADPNSWFIPITESTSASWESGTGTTAATTGSGNRDRYGADTAHPNTAGHIYLGQRLANAFRDLVLPNIK